MTRAQTRTHFHSSRLLRRLADLSVLDLAEPGTAFAEKLGLWVSFTDAITLSAVHKASTASPARHALAVKPAAAAALARVLARTRDELVRSITGSASSQGGKKAIELPRPEADASLDPEPAYEPYYRYYLAQQRDMALKLQPLRSHVRGVLAKASPALRKLAELDAALDGILGEREGKLLATVPVLLEKRFRQLHVSHRQRLMATQQSDSTDLWLQAGGWLADFCQEMQTVLLAELDVRLQPSLGLVEAFNQEITHIHD